MLGCRLLRNLFTPSRAEVSGRMPPPLTVVANEKGGFEWKPAEYEDERTYSHVVEIAKSGRARCRRCADVPRLCVGKMTRVARPALRRRHAIRSPLAPAPRPRRSRPASLPAGAAS